MNTVFTPSRELREYMARRLDMLARSRPSFKNLEWWNGHEFMVERVTGPVRRCARCDMLKPQSEYTPRWGKRNGNTYYRSNVCKPCEATRRREWAHAHPDREREHRRRYREKLRARRAA